MSTFNGLVTEFPSIRIDYFRTHAHVAPPLACFLSHVHSDHLAGLESLKSPFVYCSPTTKEILLRLEKYPHRMNFAKGILETRKQTYKHLKTILKSIPLQTTTTIELRPGLEIRVTFFDANHCPGAVSMLLQGQGNAILYTGDIRSESWWVNSLIRNPVLIPYTLGSRRLDKVYLDTTFATKNNVHKEFPSKAEGLRELLEKVQQYPNDTLFYFHSWTFGYEDVWIALSALLESQIHLDKYRWEIYSSLRNSKLIVPCLEAPSLGGFWLGNHDHEGCLTNSPTVRLHSCERGTSCSIHARSTRNVVQIIPIVTRTREGIEVAELGIGGGKGDLNQIHELELGDEGTVEQLMQLCEECLGEDPGLLAEIRQYISRVLDGDRKRIALEVESDKQDFDSMPLRNLVKILGHMATRSIQTELEDTGLNLREAPANSGSKILPEVITFPYSRHSSYSELCDLVRAFKLKDIYPCTVDEKNWDPSRSMRNLFGHLCSEDIFEHDRLMLMLYDEREAAIRGEERSYSMREESQLTTSEPEPESLSSDPSFVTRSGVAADARTSANQSDETPDTAIWVGQNHATEQDENFATAPQPAANTNGDGHVSVGDTSLAHEPLQTGRRSMPSPVPITPSKSAGFLIQAENASSPFSSSPFGRAPPAPLFNGLQGTSTPPKPKRAKSLPRQQVMQSPLAKLATPVATAPVPPKPTAIIHEARRTMNAAEQDFQDSMRTKKAAHEAALDLNGDFSWWDFGGLLSAGNNHSNVEEEF